MDQPKFFMINFEWEGWIKWSGTKSGRGKTTVLQKILSEDPTKSFYLGELRLTDLKYPVRGMEKQVPFKLDFSKSPRGSASLRKKGYELIPVQLLETEEGGGPECKIAFADIQHAVVFRSFLSDTGKANFKKSFYNGAIWINNAPTQAYWTPVPINGLEVVYREFSEQERPGENEKKPKKDTSSDKEKCPEDGKVSLLSDEASAEGADESDEECLFTIREEDHPETTGSDWRTRESSL